MLNVNDHALSEHTLMLLYNCVRQAPQLRYIAFFSPLLLCAMFSLKKILKILKIYKKYNSLFIHTENS
jgi:hypothetical protein